MKKKYLFLLFSMIFVFLLLNGCKGVPKASEQEGKSLLKTEDTQKVQGESTRTKETKTKESDITLLDSEVEWEATKHEGINNLDSVSMEVEEQSISPTGLTIKITNESELRLIYGDYYELEKKHSNKWLKVPVIFEGNYGFNDIGYEVPPKGESEWKVDLEWLYGKLKPGQYRIIKDVSNFRETGDFDIEYLAAEFIIN